MVRLVKSAGRVDRLQGRSHRQCRDDRVSPVERLDHARDQAGANERTDTVVNEDTIRGAVTTRLQSDHDRALPRRGPGYRQPKLLVVRCKRLILSCITSTDHNLNRRDCRM